MALIRIPQNLNIQFIRFKFFPVLLLLAAFFITAFGYFTKGLNLGIDFKGGIVIEAQFLQKPDLNFLRSQLKKDWARDFAIQELGSNENTLLIRTESLEKDQNFIQDLKKSLGQGVSFRKIEMIGPKVGSELMVNSLYAVFWAMVSIMFYVWLRFNFHFGLCAMIALFHDCIAVLGFFALTQKEFNEGAIVAILMTAAYSINDTVIIFDRIREKISYRKGEPFKDIINTSLNETLSRTLLTSFTTLLALGILCIFGGEVISSFCFPIFFGILFGTYSSIFISAPLLVLFSKEKN